MKYKRQQEIISLINKFSIETQEDLAKHLEELGFNVTQATISRDIKELRLVKVLDNDKYKYVQSKEKSSNNMSLKLAAVFRDCVTQIDYAKNIVVIKTLNGMASGTAGAIDSMNLKEVVGTIAGDDTIFVVLRSDEAAVNFAYEQNKMLK
jgi:transcriptional regulator of arginine metabolism